jgi:hypothetical protein
MVERIGKLLSFEFPALLPPVTASDSISRNVEVTR